MDYRSNVIRGLQLASLLALAAIQASALGKSAPLSLDRNERQRYIVVLSDPPLSKYDGRSIATPERKQKTTRLMATANRFTGARKLDTRSSRSQQYLKFLDERFESFRGEALLRLGRQIKPRHRYRSALNGFSVDLSALEAKALREVPGVVAITPNIKQKPMTDSGPAWIGADKIHDGSAGFPANRGEGIVVGIVDFGINWDHPSFADPGEGGQPGYDHVNPYGSQLGLCFQAEVKCNDKLVGVYDFVEDNPETEVVEENNNGKDNSGHGAHVASIAVGNPLNVNINGIPAVIGGVAPNANFISYRVCYLGDPADPGDDGCDTDAILAAIEQAIDDGVDVINYSLGSTAHDPWYPGTSTYELLSVRTAGILFVTSAGNFGPNAATMGSPANAPWVTAVGQATHDRVFASLLENLSGGDTTPPPTLIGASWTDGIGIRKIVHARDYGNALCGTGVSEGGLGCDDNSGASNPFTPGTFNGEIVVCDRGDYGRVEKGKNLLLAGAGGYVLTNTDDWGEDTVADHHCLPTTHVGAEDGNKLRSWLDSGANHQGSLSGFDIFHIPEAGDVVSYFSSRGPNPPPVENVMKPDVIAPGTEIIGASDVEQEFLVLGGTSMSSPHVAGAAALLKAVHPDWTPDAINSALVMTATPERAIDYDDSEAPLHKRGAGRVRLDQAVNAGLYLAETVNDFDAADPYFGGDPKALNLPGLVDTVCRESCSFQRTVTDLVGGASWSASAQKFPSGVQVSFSPGNFTLSSGGSRTLGISIDLTNSGIVGEWVYGEIHLASNGLPDAVFPVAVFADGGALPAEWQIESDAVSGWQEFSLDGLAKSPDTTFTSGGLVEPLYTVENLPQDPDNNSPYDTDEGTMTVWFDVTEDTLWLHTETLASTSNDLDLFVGLDSNDDGVAQQAEQLCSSESEDDIELCDLFTPVPGRYWAIVQNWTAGNSLDEVTLKSAVVGKENLSRLTATGTGIVELRGTHDIRLSWDNVSALPGTELFGAVGIGTKREQPNNIGIIPVRFTKTGAAQPETLVLMNGVSRGLTLAGGATHDRVFLDIPSGIGSFSIETSAVGANGPQNQDLGFELYRQDFDQAFTDVPFAAAANTGGAPVATASGSGGSGPGITISGNDVAAGRWYVVLKNSGGQPVEVVIRADLVFSGSPIPVQFGLFESEERQGFQGGIHQGIDFNASAQYRALLWYTYNEDGTPTWYQAATKATDGNVTVAELLRYTNDGAEQQAVPVGHVSVTVIGENDLVFSFVLFGRNGSDRMKALPWAGCPTIGIDKQSYNGLWSEAVPGQGGASAYVSSNAQAFIHYLYDDSGNPAWLTASPEPQSPTATDLDYLQWSGFCIVCEETEPTYTSAGVFSRSFADEHSLSWLVNYALKPPLSGAANRADETVKLTVTRACP